MATKPEEVMTQEATQDVAEEYVEAEVKSELENGPGSPPPEYFMTLDQAKKRLDKDICSIIEMNVWDSVVLIEVPVHRSASKVKYNYGTGFVFLGPKHQKLVMTNYHVVRNRDSSLPIRVHFFYEDNGHSDHEDVTDNPVYYSRKGEQERVDYDHLDFAVLKVENIPERLKSKLTPLIHTAERGNFAFHPAMKEFENDHPPRMSTEQGIIIGHPDGGPKRISVVHFQPGRSDDLKRRYSQTGTWGGSSGSPVLINAMNPIFTPHTVTILHYGVKKDKTGARDCGVGVNTKYVLEAINRDFCKELNSEELRT